MFVILHLTIAFVTEIIAAYENQFVGAIPSEIGLLTNLGMVGHCFGSCCVMFLARARVAISLWHARRFPVHFQAPVNMISGSVPSEIGTLTNLGWSLH